MNDALISAGAQCGVNVEAIFNKYTNKESKSAEDKNEAGKLEEVVPPLRCGKLDDLVVCKRCNGMGIIKEHYNHQVKDVNCNECGGDGLISIRP